MPRTSAEDDGRRGKAAGLITQTSRPSGLIKEGDGERVPGILHGRVSRTEGRAWVSAEKYERIVCLRETSGKSQLKREYKGILPRRLS